MNITFHSISDDRKKINKTLNPIASVSAQLKTPSSVMRPVIQVTKAAMGTEWYRINYAFIPEFGRYYFVDNAIAENDGIVTFELTVDVLFTYAQQLMITQFQVVRAQRFYDAYFMDTQIPTKSNKAIRQSSTTDFLGSIPQSTGTTKNNYVLTVSGG